MLAAGWGVTPGRARKVAAVEMMRVATKVAADTAAIFMGGLIFYDLKKETVMRIIAVVARAVNIATPHDRSPRSWVGGGAALVDLESADVIVTGDAWRANSVAPYANPEEVTEEINVVKATLMTTLRGEPRDIQTPTPTLQLIAWHGQEAVAACGLGWGAWRREVDDGHGDFFGTPVDGSA